MMLSMWLSEIFFSNKCHLFFLGIKYIKYHVIPVQKCSILKRKEISGMENGLNYLFYAKYKETSNH